MMELSEDEVIINLKYLKAAFFDLIVSTVESSEDGIILSNKIILLQEVIKEIERVGVK